MPRFTDAVGCAKIKWLVPSSSGLGRLVLIQKIAGSTPAGITTSKSSLLKLLSNKLENCFFFGFFPLVFHDSSTIVGFTRCNLSYDRIFSGQTRKTCIS